VPHVGRAVPEEHVPIALSHWHLEGDGALLSWAMTTRGVQEVGVDVRCCQAAARPTVT
jgi:hypothetical protein